ncbi:hypothetical protein BDF22DRAFT_695564 [Syncephalis plumigaleata]|nr:hypothetical protein BDF22DRAFT_695564 [Syncephalis plumigaleata]
MADRGRRGRGGGRGGAHGGGHGAGGDNRPKKEAILDLTRYMDTQVRIKFTGGREVTGVLKGHDPLLNLVLDEAEEHLRDPENHFRLLDKTRSLGLVVCRGTAVTLLSPLDGSEEIPNPFMTES